MNQIENQLNGITNQSVRRLTPINGGQPILICDEEVELLESLHHAFVMSNVKDEICISKQIRNLQSRIDNACANDMSHTRNLSKNV